jgi:hypothetical protein
MAQNAAGRGIKSNSLLSKKDDSIKLGDCFLKEVYYTTD